MRPAVIVALGATALTALLRGKVSLRDYVDAPFRVEGGWRIATYRPSFALRQQNDADCDKVLAEISNALIRARELAESATPAATKRQQ